MTTEQLQRLNRILGDKMGTIPEGHRESGQPRFRWMRSEELMFLVRTGTKRVTYEAQLLSAVEDLPICEWRRQCKRDNVWVLAKWIDPPDSNEWERLYGSALGYPREGYWFMITPLRPGIEPDEEFCHLCADQLDWQKSLDFTTTLNLIMAQEERQARSQKAVTDALIENVFTQHVPGARGGSYSAPYTKFDR